VVDLGALTLRGDDRRCMLRGVSTQARRAARARAPRVAWAWAALVAAGCDGATTPPPTSSLGGWPTRPAVVEPRVDEAQVETASIARVRTTPPTIEPPVVRGTQQVDAFRQDQAQVDVLWVIDNSASLNEERMGLAAQFDRFLRVLVAAGVDFHVGVTSTDLDARTGDGGRLRGAPRFIDSRTPNAAEVFRRAVSFPASDVRLEEGLSAMYAALTPPNRDGANAGFLRPDAALAVIVLSDEDDGSVPPAAFYARFLKNLKGQGREGNVSFSAVAGPLPDGCVPAGQEDVFGAEADPAVRYQEVVDATNGVFGSVCANDFSRFVTDLATRLGSLRRVFPLSAPPVTSTIVVRVNGRVVPMGADTGWTFRGGDRTIVFEGRYVPPPRAAIEIEYDVAR
jgi:hypothetical protein